LDLLVVQTDHSLRELDRRGLDRTIWPW
jgi:hypothetical protein